MGKELKKKRVDIHTCITDSAHVYSSWQGWMKNKKERRYRAGR